MIISRNWLREYVPLEMTVEELTHRLTMSGLNLEEFHDVDDDVAVDVEVTSNRSDCLGHIGVAREVAVLFDLPLRIPTADVSNAESSEPCSGQTSVMIECPDLCHAYHARLLKGVKIGPSPGWLRDRLRAVGINSVNNVVDVTNYVMLECGQPLHAFDFDKLAGEQIIVRRSVSGEKIRAIDQRDYELPAETCVIADAERPVAVAGVMGGFDTEISDDTVNVLIETASFDPLSVRGTARALKLHSPSSFRFERRVDRHRLDWASRRCCELILQVAGGSLQAGSVAAGEQPSSPEAIRLRFLTVDRLLGITISADECVSILTSLGLTCANRTDESADFIPPTWRQDLTRECDLVEEVARIHGYEHIPDDADLPVVATTRSRREHVGDTIRRVLPACGFFEAMTLSFVSEDLQSLFRPFGLLTSVAVQHSTRSHENLLRQSLIPSLLQCRRQNERHGTLNAELFEVAKVYLSAGEGKAEAEAEPTTIGIVSGREFVGLKGVTETLICALVPGAQLTNEPCDLPEFAAGRAARLLLNGRFLGVIGELSRDVTDRLDLQDSVTIAELCGNVLEDCFESTRHYRPLPRFPVVSRDLNFVLKESVRWSDLADLVKTSAGELLHDVEFAGQYRGKQIAADRKSYLLTCRFLSPDRTLTAEEVDDAVQKIVSACQEELDGVLR